MDLNRFNRRRTSRIYLYILLLIACSFLSFLLGVVMLRNGTLRKLYDIYDAVVLSSEKIPNIQASEKPDTLYIQLSKKNYNRLVKLRSDSFLTPKNYLNHSNWQWVGEKPWYSAKFSTGKDTFSHAKIKLIGMNSDHFREGKNWSIRVKLKDDIYFKGYQKFNLLNPYSRGFFIDAFYSRIYQQQGGLYIDQIPVFTKLEDNLEPQVLEPFFSKELLELQKRRDYLILAADSVDKNGKKHLKVVHPNNLISSLSKSQQQVFQFYDSIYALNHLAEYYNKKDYAFLTAVALCTGGQTHHFNGFNLFLYADPISGDLKPFLREVSPLESRRIIFNYDSLKFSFYKENNLSSFARKFVAFDHKVDEYVSLIQSLKVESVIQGDKDLSNLYSFVNKSYPWSIVYKNRLRAKLSGLETASVKLKLSKKVFNFSGSVYLKDTIVNFQHTDSLNFANGTKFMLQNSTILFSDLNLRYTGFKKLIFEGDSLSTLIFDNSNISLTNVSFKGFGNSLSTTIKNRVVTGAITFANSNVLLRDVHFSNNYSGDDLVNFFRCKVDINRSSFNDAKADGVDFDFTSGLLKNSKVLNCGNDGFDLGGSSLQIKNTLVSNCGDKGISIGEASEQVLLDSVSLASNEIGISLKDASVLSLSSITFTSNKVDFVGYGKKAQYGHSVLAASDLDFSKISYLIEPDLILPAGVNVFRTKKVIDLMYGKKYGQKSIR